MEISAEAKARLERMLVEHGMTQKAFMSRVVSWVAGLDLNERSVILGQVRGDSARLILEALAAPGELPRVDADAVTGAGPPQAKTRRR